MLMLVAIPLSWIVPAWGALVPVSGSGYVQCGIFAAMLEPLSDGIAEMETDENA